MKSNFLDQYFLDGVAGGVGLRKTVDTGETIVVSEMKEFIGMILYNDIIGLIGKNSMFKDFYNGDIVSIIDRRSVSGLINSIDVFSLVDYNKLFDIFYKINDLNIFDMKFLKGSLFYSDGVSNSDYNKIGLYTSLNDMVNEDDVSIRNTMRMLDSSLLIDGLDVMNVGFNLDDNVSFVDILVQASVLMVRMLGDIIEFVDEYWFESKLINESGLLIGDNTGKNVEIEKNADVLVEELFVRDLYTSFMDYLGFLDLLNKITILKNDDNVNLVSSNNKVIFANISELVNLSDILAFVGQVINVILSDVISLIDLFTINVFVNGADLARIMDIFAYNVGIYKHDLVDLTDAFELANLLSIVLKDAIGYDDVDVVLKNIISNTDSVGIDGMLNLRKALVQKLADIVYGDDYISKNIDIHNVDIVVVSDIIILRQLLSLLLEETLNYVDELKKAIEKGLVDIENVSDYLLPLRQSIIFTYELVSKILKRLKLISELNNTIVAESVVANELRLDVDEFDIVIERESFIYNDVVIEVISLEQI